MRSRFRRRSAVLAVLGLLAGLVPALLGATPASAGTATTPTSCTNTAQAGTSQLDNTLTGTATPNPQTLGTSPGDDTLTLAGATFGIDVPGTVLLAGYGLKLLQPGVNSIPADVEVTILGSNTAEDTQTLPPVTVLGVTTITDPTPWLPGPDGILQTTDPMALVKATGSDDVSGRTSGDESATPLAVSAPLPTSTWDPTGGDVAFSLGGSSTTALVGPGGAIAVNFTCVPGIPGPAGCGAAPAPACTDTIPVAAAPFDTVTVVAPPTPPVCTNESGSVGITQSVPINLVDNCTDVNGNIDLTTFTLSPPSVGSISGTDGSYTYTAPATDPGAPVTMSFTVSDAGGLVSNVGTVSIGILANSCDATSAACALTEIVVQPVVGTVMTLDKGAGLVVMDPVVLNGQAQASNGSLQNLLVTNARGSSAGWTLSGFVTDLGAPGSPTITLPTGQTIAACSNAGSAGGAFGGGTTPDRLCIPGDNMGWNPTSLIAHDVIFGDVAQVNSGPADATSSADWLAQLVAAGAAGKDGIGGLQENNVLCSSPANHSGGTFVCDAALYLGVPASAGAGTYSGGLVLTLL